jgi:hypothetical protein
MLLNKLIQGLDAGDVLEAHGRLYDVTQHVPGSHFRVQRRGGKGDQVVHYQRHPEWAQEWAQGVTMVLHQLSFA